ncbi:MAG: ABC transporter substrate-binding protein [Bacillota bacterium]|nr:ABC transporter substrate-binding protein [Bacillota bacterium]
MAIINKYMSVYNIINIFPETLDVFVSHGLNMFEDENILNDVGKFIKLNTILNQRKINIDLFVNQLEEKISQSKKHQNQNNDENIYTKEKLNVLGLLPCPLKMPLENAFEQFIEDYKNKTNTDINYCLASNSNNQLNYYDYVDEFQNIEEIPDIIISPGINGFFRKNFVDKFINKGYFVDVSNYEPNETLKKIGYQDPKHNYSMISMNILVMAVNTKKLDNAPIPKTWVDLLNPVYEKKVAIRGNNKNSFCETVLSAFYKESGMEGIKQLSKSVKEGWHPSQMVKSLNSNKSDNIAICVLPYFYSKMINNEDVTIVWPEDGALVNPISMLVKKSKFDELKDIAHYLAGDKIGQIFADAFYPSVNPQVNNRLPKDASLKWLGWDYINSNNMGDLVKKINASFALSQCRNGRNGTVNNYFVGHGY